MVKGAFPYSSQFGAEMLYELNSLCEESRLARLKGKSVSRGVKFTHNSAISVHFTFYSFIGKFTH